MEKQAQKEMSRAEEAVAAFKERFSCSQAVFSAFSVPLGVKRKTALKLSQSFGGGMARMGETCGAVTGAFLVIGLKYGRTRAEDEAAREKTYALVLEFVKRFKRRHGSIKCRELLGIDVSKASGWKEVHKRKLIETLCPRLVRSAAEILEEIL